MSDKKKKLGRIPLPNKPPKIINTHKKRILEALLLDELEEEVTSFFDENNEEEE